MPGKEARRAKHVKFTRGGDAQVVSTVSAIAAVGVVSLAQVHLLQRPSLSAAGRGWLLGLIPHTPTGSRCHTSREIDCNGEREAGVHFFGYGRPLTSMTRRQFILSTSAVRCWASQEPIFRSETALVLIDAQVLNRDTGKVISSLNREDFEVLDEGEPREIKVFDFGSVALDLVLLLDVSGSMIEASRALVQTLRWAVEDLLPRDRVALMTFSAKPKIVLGLTQSRSELLREAESSVAHTLRLDQGTRLYDALAAAAELLRSEGKPSQDRRRAVLVLTDDKESRSKAKLEAVVTELLESNATANAVVIHTREPAGGGRITRIGIPIPGVPPIVDDRRKPAANRVYLSIERIVNETGGEMTSRREREDFLGEMFARIRSRYLLGFYPPSEINRPAFRRLTVRLGPAKQKEYPRALIRARAGYRLETTPN